MGVSGKFVLTAAIAALALALAGCGTGNGSRPSTVFGGYTAPVTVEGLQVTCGPDGAITAPPVASVGRDGLHVKVNDRTGSKGTHLNYTVVSSDAAPDVIRSLPVGTADLVIPEPPGGLYLSCSQGKGSKAGDDVTVLAVDVHSYYRYAALAALGCEPSLKADLGPSARGKTEQGALDALMVASKRTDMKAKLAPVGYVDAGYSSYLLERDGDPQVVATVSRDGAAYEARVVHYCT